MNKKSIVFKTLQVLAIIICCIFMFGLVTNAGFWDDLTDLFDGISILERLANATGALEKDIQELENEKLLEKQNANRCDEEEEKYSDAIKTYQESYNAAYADYSAALTLRSGAEARKGLAESDISSALDMLYELSGSSASSGVIDYWRAKLADARARKSAAEADIAMAQSIIDAASVHMSVTDYHIQVATSMVAHFAQREQFHRDNVDRIQGEIDAKTREIAAKQAEIDRINSEYDNSHN